MRENMPGNKARTLQLARQIWRESRLPTAGGPEVGGARGRSESRSLAGAEIAASAGTGSGRDGGGAAGGVFALGEAPVSRWRRLWPQSRGLEPEGPSGLQVRRSAHLTAGCDGARLSCPPPNEQRFH